MPTPVTEPLIHSLVIHFMREQHFANPESYGINAHNVRRWRQFGVVFALLTGLFVWHVGPFSAGHFSEVRANDIQSPAQSLAAVGQGDDSAIWRTQKRCGINAMYIFLQVLGAPVSYDDILKTLPVKEGGTSMADLKRFTSHWVSGCTVIRTTDRGLESQQCPAIAYVREDSGQQGHFVVVCDVGPTGVRIIDGTAGAVTVETMDKFLKQWDGYLLVRPRQNSIASYLWCSIGILGLLLAVQATVARRPKRLIGETAGTLTH